MKKQLETPQDVELMVKSFYAKVLKDEMLSPFFKYTVHHNWQHHLDVLNKFWNNVLFYSGGYIGNPLQTHKQIHEAKPLSQENFDQWLHLFFNTVDELFEGEKAELAKQRAKSIATVMQIKIIQPKDDDLIY